MQTTHLSNPGLELRTSRGWGWGSGGGGGGGQPAVIDWLVNEAHVGDWTNHPNECSECLLLGFRVSEDGLCVPIQIPCLFIYFFK